jgi:hypothetical protein
MEMMKNSINTFQTLQGLTAILKAGLKPHTHNKLESKPKKSPMNEQLIGPWPHRLHGNRPRACAVKDGMCRKRTGINQDASSGSWWACWKHKKEIP